MDQARAQNKLLYAKYLQDLLALAEVQTALLSKFGANHRIEQYKACYKHQTLQILAYQFCSVGGTNHAKVLQLSLNDHYRSLSMELDHLADTGLGMVVLDTNNNVCFVMYNWDECDMPKINIRNANYRRKYEICSAAFDKDPTYTKVMSPSKKPMQYGDVFYLDKGGIRPDLIGKGGLAMVDISILIALLMGYKCVYTLQTAPNSIKWGDRLARDPTYKDIMLWQRTSNFDFSHLIFKDNTSIQQCYETLARSGYDANHIRTHHSNVAILFGFRNMSQKLTIQKAIQMLIDRTKIQHKKIAKL